MGIQMQPGLDKFMKQIIAFSFIISLMSCNSPIQNTWHTLDFGAFKITTPGDWKSYKLRGIDSYIGGLTNGNDSLEFDYGWYSAEVGDEDTLTHLFAQDTVNGLLASVVIPKIDRDGCIRMSMRVTTKNKFSIGGCNVENTDTILKIFKSIVFSESDTSKNGSLSKAKFKEGSHGSGKTIFIVYCASCHSFTKNLTGPALITSIEKRDAKWLRLFLTDKKAILSDTTYLNSRKTYDGMLCPDNFKLSETEVDMLLSYFRTYSSDK